MAPPAHREKIREIVADVSGVFSAYLRGLLNVSLLYSLAVTALLLGFKTPNAVAIGVMAGILYMVPYLGALLTVLVGGLATLLLDGTARALTVSFLLLLTNQLFDYIITPRIMQRHVGLPPLANIFALVTAGTMFGLPGVLLAVPVAASLMVVLQNLYPRLLGVPSATEPKPAEGAGPEPAP